MNPDIEKHTTVLGQGTVPVNSLPVGQKVDRVVSLGEVMSTIAPILTCFEYPPLVLGIWKVKLHVILRSAVFL